MNSRLRTLQISRRNSTEYNSFTRTAIKDKEYGPMYIARMMILLAVFTVLSPVTAKDSCVPGSGECQGSLLKICDLSKSWVHLDCPTGTKCQVSAKDATCVKDGEERSKSDEEEPDKSESAEDKRDGHDDGSSDRKDEEDSSDGNNRDKDSDGKDDKKSGKKGRRKPSSYEVPRLTIIEGTPRIPVRPYRRVFYEVVRGIPSRRGRKGNEKGTAGKKDDKFTNTNKKDSNSKGSNDEMQNNDNRSELNGKGNSSNNGSSDSSSKSDDSPGNSSNGGSSDSTRPANNTSGSKDSSSNSSSSKQVNSKSGPSQANSKSGSSQANSKSNGNGSNNKENKPTVVTVTKETKTPPMEIKLEYSMPNGVAPKVDTLKSSDGKTFAQSTDKSAPGSEKKAGQDSQTAGMSKGPQSAAPGSGSSPSGSSQPSSSQQDASKSNGPQAGGASPGPSKTGSAPQSGGAKSSGGSSSPSQPASSQSSGSKPASSQSSGSKPASSQSPGSKSSTSKDSSSGSSQPSSGEIISKDKLTEIMKSSGFNPNEQYLDVALKGAEEEIKDKDIAAMYLAQIAHESGGFQYLEEIECSKDANACAGRYGSDPSGKSYHGRGFIQLTWPDNYKKAGEGINMGTQLYDNPDMVAKDPEIASKVSIWYWNTIVMPEMGGKKEFGLSTKAINGKLECGGGGNEKAEKRYKIYTAICEAMSITPSPNTGC